jgi:hypothetical protein
MNEKLEAMIKESLLKSGVEYVAPSNDFQENLWLQFLETFGKPIVLGKWNLSTIGFTSEEDQAAIDEIVEFMEKYRG